MIVDASVAVKWFVDEPLADRARGLRSNELAAPDLLVIEVANALWRKVRGGEGTSRGAREALGALRRGPVKLRPAVELVDRAIEMALELGHPVYDCVYLALAERQDDRLATADRRLVAVVGGAKKHRDRVVWLGDL